MQITVSNKLTVYDPSETLRKWAKDNLEIPNPDYAKKIRMGLWTGKTPPTLFLYERDGDTLVFPTGVLGDILMNFPSARNVIWDSIMDHGSKRVEYRDNVPLYDYQRKAVDVVAKYNYGILQAPAGSGKTQMGISIIQKLGRKTLWLTHTKDLLQQSMDRALTYIPRSLIGTITEGKVDIGSGITFATVQTISRLDLTQYRYEWDAIIVDECHRVAGTPTTMTMFAKVLNSLAATYKIGLSATVHRADGMIRATYTLLGPILYSVPEEAVADRIMKVGVCPIRTSVSINRDCMNPDGTLNYQGMIEYLTEDADRNRLIVSTMVLDEGHPSLVLSTRIEHLKTLMDMLPESMKAKAAHISGKTPKAVREKVLEQMRTGELDYLFATYTLAKEGLDIPRLDRLYMATPQKDYAVVVQSIGRIARTCEGKEKPVCYDYVDRIPYLEKCYKDRCKHYKKVGAYYIGKENA